MDIFNTKGMLALGLSGMMSVGASHAGVAGANERNTNSIVAISGPDVRVTVYDGIATVVGIAGSSDEASEIETQIAAVDGVDHVINLIAWQDKTAAE